MTDARGSDRLVTEVRDLGGDAEHLVAVDLERFFEGNEDLGSIAPNLSDHPGPAAIYELLTQLRDRPDVSSVVVLVRLEQEEYAAGEWPFGEAVLAVTSASLEQIDAMAATIGADPAFEGPWDETRNSPPVPDGERIVTIWWD